VRGGKGPTESVTGRCWFNSVFFWPSVLWPQLITAGGPFVKDQLESLIMQLVDRGVPFPAAANEFEKKYIRRVLEHTRGKQARPARMLGMHRNTLSRKIEEYELEVRNGHTAR